MPDDTFNIINNFPSYISKPEITNVKPNFLVKGSKNVLLDYANRIISRNGYTVLGRLGKELISNGNFVSSATGWTLDSGWVYDTEKVSFDPAIAGNASIIQTINPNEGYTYEVSFDLVATLPPIVQYGIVSVGGTDMSITVAGHNVFTITSADGVFFSIAGDGTSVPFSVTNISVKEVISPTATGVRGSYEWDTSTIKQFPLRSSGSSLEFYWNSTWNLLASGLTTPYLEFAKIWDNTEKIDVLLWVLGDTNTYKWSGGVAKIRSSAPTTLTKQGVITAQTTIAFIAGTPGTVAASITDSGNNFLNAGFAVGDILYVLGSAGNSRIFTIGSVTAGVITLIMTDVLVSEVAGTSITLHTGEPTWAASRFLTAGTRKVHYNGVDYTYTGGEATDTLTGLTSFPSVTIGDPVWQTPITLANPGDIPASFKQNLIAVQLNQLILGSTKSQEIYISSTTDYTDFTLTSPRAPGDPAKVTMDQCCTCIVPIDNEGQTTSSLMFGGGINEFFQLSYQLSQDNLSELVRMVKLKTAAGAGVISKDAICPIKDTTAYISHEPVLEILSNIQKIDTEDKPLSDDIKNDFDAYDFTDAHVRYWKRSIYIAVPRNGVILIYDLQRKLWQPPQTIAISRLAIIDDELYGHSAIANESYRLFVGTNDNGNFISQVARFAYNNGGDRSRLKLMSEAWSDGYITPNAILNFTIYYGFEGIVGKTPLIIDGGDEDIVNPLGGSPLGDESLGATPIGGDNLEPITSLPGTTATLLRFWQVDTASFRDYTEMFFEYTMQTLDGQFALVAYGTDQSDAGTAPVSHKK